eukprot:8336633-Pyramimonas_sp.AAC.1
MMIEDGGGGGCRSWESCQRFAKRSLYSISKCMNLIPPWIGSRCRNGNPSSTQRMQWMLMLRR